MTATIKPFVFVLMPFSKEFKDIYHLGIKSACDTAGCYCERVDEQIFTESILERIYNQIAKADLIVADMSGRNPDVFYEVGYAHALEKQVILLTQKVEDIPFDLKHFPHIIYGSSIRTLKEELQKRVFWVVNHPSQKINKTDLELEFYSQGIKLINDAIVPVHGYALPNYEVLILTIDMHNPTYFSSQFSEYQLGIIGDWVKDTNGTITKYLYEAQEEIGQFETPVRYNEILMLPDGKKMIFINRPQILNPQQWYTTTVCVPAKKNATNNLILRIIGDFTQKDITLTMDKQLVDITDPTKLSKPAVNLYSEEE